MEDSLTSRPEVGRHRPITVISVRYGGIYEGGRWAALPLRPAEVPPEATGNDVECQGWWERPPLAVGLDTSPDRAVAVLDDVIDQCPHPEDFRHQWLGGWTCGYCQQGATTKDRPRRARKSPLRETASR